MNRSEQSGFVLIVVLCLAALAGMAVTILASGSNAMRSDLQRMEYDYARRNLTASGLAWAELNARKSAGRTPPAGKELRLDGMEMPNAALGVTVTASPGGKLQVRIRTTCRCGRRLIKKDSHHSIPATFSE